MELIEVVKKVLWLRDLVVNLGLFREFTNILIVRILFIW